MNCVPNLSPGGRDIWGTSGSLNPPRGHVFRVERVRRPGLVCQYRLPDGRQVQEKLRPAWTARGRPAAGYFTKRLAEDWLLHQEELAAHWERARALEPLERIAPLS